MTFDKCFLQKFGVMTWATHTHTHHSDVCVGCVCVSPHRAPQKYLFSRSGCWPIRVSMPLASPAFCSYHHRLHRVAHIRIFHLYLSRRQLIVRRCCCVAFQWPEIFFHGKYLSNRVADKLLTAMRFVYTKIGACTKNEFIQMFGLKMKCVNCN